MNASIIDFYVSKGQRTKQGTGDSTYYFTYTWVDGQGVAHKARNSVSLETYFAHKSRASSYEIAYLPEDPERHMSRADVESRNPERSLIVGAVIALVGFYLLAAMGFVGLAGIAGGPLDNNRAGTGNAYSAWPDAVRRARTVPGAGVSPGMSARAWA